MRFLWFISCIFLVACQTKLLEPPKDVPSKQNTDVSRLNYSNARIKHTQKKPASSVHDGAPVGHVPSIFKEVVPVSAPFSRYGNPSTYQVNGHTYEVMTSLSGYRVRGLASWYGTKFHKLRTSSGEKYDMYALTAAHKTLPIPCYVRVKNLDNGRMSVVKVNDRGPFHEGRVIDLSYAAAVKLGLLPKGTAHVEVEALTVKRRGGSPVAHFYVQAGAFKTRAFAESLRIKLSHLTPSPVFIESYQQHFLVRVGPFADRAMTEQLKRTLRQQGVEGSFSLLI
jgi:rare lipoprotein A